MIILLLIFIIYSLWVTPKTIEITNVVVPDRTRRLWWRKWYNLPNRLWYFRGRRGYGYNKNYNNHLLYNNKSNNYEGRITNEECCELIDNY